VIIVSFPFLPISTEALVDDRELGGQLVVVMA
jgi:hypothetical protein